MTAVLSLGSNLGDRAAHLNAAIELLRMHYTVLAVSPVYETAPVGVRGSPAFLNLIVEVAARDAEQLLEVARSVENTRGRSRSKRWAPRTLDVDVRNTAAAEPSLQLALELEVLGQVGSEIVFCKPMRVPVFVIADPKAVWMNFLSHIKPILSLQPLCRC